MNFITELLNTVNSGVDQYIFDGYHALVTNLSPTLTTLGVIYFAGLGWLVIRGLIPLTPLAVAWHMIRAAFVFAFAMHWDYFSFFFQAIFIKSPDHLIGLILSGSGSNTPNTITQALADFWTTGNNVFTSLWLNYDPEFLLGIIMGLLGHLTLIAITATALFYLLMSKIALSILLMLAPLIFPMFLWTATRSVFNSWLQLLVEWAITPLFLYAFLALFLKPLQVQVNIMSHAGATTASISAFVLLAVIAILVFKQAGVLSRRLAQKIETGDVGTSSENVPLMAFKALNHNRGF